MQILNAKYIWICKINVCYDKNRKSSSNNNDDRK